MAYRFNPFNKDIKALTPDDLAVLRDTHEGWFLDYKSEGITPRDFGKHLSAFANQFGGWLIVGVSEGPDKSMRADSFPGVPSEDVATILTNLREGVVAHVSPPVFFEYTVLNGPSTNIGLPSTRAIIVIGVPESYSPPHVHSSGRIYRRVADSSDPRHETDRGVLDAMWRKTQQSEDRLRTFLLEPVQTAGARGAINPYCYLYLLMDRTFSGPAVPLTFEHFRDTVTSIPPKGLSVALETVFVTQDGFIGRHVADNNPLHDGLSLRWWMTGNVRITIPINRFSRDACEHLHDDVVDDFCVALRRHRWPQDLDLIDFDQVVTVMVALVHQYMRLLKPLELRHPILGKALISDMRGRVPFIGLPSFITHCTEYGVPVVQDSLLCYPNGLSFNDFKELSDPGENVPQDDVRAFGLALPIILNVLRAVGVPVDTIDMDQLIDELSLVVMARGITTKRRR